MKECLSTKADSQSSLTSSAVDAYCQEGGAELDLHAPERVGLFTLTCRDLIISFLYGALSLSLRLTFYVLYYIISLSWGTVLARD